jgi:hypothetical protein
MRVWWATVTEVAQVDVESWRIQTTHGADIVNREGEAASIVPLDEQLAEQLARNGDGYLVESTVRDIERHLDQSLDWQSLEQNLDDGWGHRRCASQRPDHDAGPFPRTMTG